MTDYVTLMGTEEVSKAASRMVSAAEEYKRAIAQQSDDFFRHQRFLDEWLARFEQVLDNYATD